MQEIRLPQIKDSLSCWNPWRFGRKRMEVTLKVGTEINLESCANNRLFGLLESMEIWKRKDGRRRWN